MGEFEDKVSKLLSSPEGMEQILSVARMLSAQGSAPAVDPGSKTAETAYRSEPPIPAPGAPTAESAPPAPGSADLSQILASLSGLTGKDGLGGLKGLLDLDPKIISTALSLLGEATAPNDKSAALLYALKPYLKEERQPKIDRALQIARLVRVGKKFFSGLNGGKADV